MYSCLSLIVIVHFLHGGPSRLTLGVPRNVLINDSALRSLKRLLFLPLPWVYGRYFLRVQEHRLCQARILHHGNNYFLLNLAANYSWTVLNWYHEWNSVRPLLLDNVREIFVDPWLWVVPSAIPPASPVFPEQVRPLFRAYQSVGTYWQRAEPLLRTRSQRERGQKRVHRRW